MRELAPVLIAGIVPFLIFFLIVAGSAAGVVQWNPPKIWSIDFGTPNSVNGVSSISGDASSLYAGGFIGYPSPLNVTPSSLFVNRYDLEGHQIWSRLFSNPQDSEIGAVSSRQGNIYVSGVLSMKLFVERYDINGNQLWNTTLASGQVFPAIVSVSPSGLYVGYTMNSVSGGGSFLRSYDSNGNVLWTVATGNQTDNSGVYVGATGVYALVGFGTANSTLDKFDMHGQLLWSRSWCCATIGTKGIAGDGDSIYAVTNGPYLSLLMKKFDANGNNVWSDQFFAPDNGIGDCEVTADPSGAYVTVETGPGHSFLMKFGMDSTIGWSLEISPRGSSREYGVPIFADGGSLYLGGSLPKPESTLNAQLAQFSESSSLIFFGLIPPWSFLTVGAMVAVAATSIFLFKKLRRNIRPGRIGPSSKSVPVAD